ncbi:MULTISPECIES: HlyD family efflux transporter periplasmic adaptor subunit [unclassified Rhizobium]|jgi:multidrug resistance efflux pump|uniref:HlyD family secretion protein n=1 Tax=unclassified Rhizobium TaxID=2613769 RepID=UPI000648CF77|nr:MULTISPECIES: HlyD family efflux transporter periplasmic adaptor subunit [unclassified Rhizobium]MBN8952408.1 HlyD family efflux transporter periplasmic adaptor subunit [Rhizobium tropici]OJY78894.1 MAG: auxiliary transport protein, membrane fusion protein (MFP) family [Rhizobium sp. 60-20]RKD67607.1 biotin/lipoyl-binding protein [Rhizobium sp. WW_1]
MDQFKRSRRLWATGLLGSSLILGPLWMAVGTPRADENSNSTERAAPAIAAAARGTVDVEGGLYRITAVRDGIVAEVRAIEGAYVRKGDLLAVLDRRQEESTVRIAEQELSQAEDRHKLLELKGRNLSKTYERMRRAAAGKAVSDQALEDARDAYETQAIETNSAATTVTIAQERLEMAKREISLREIRAPADGVVVRQAVKAGEAVSTQMMSEMFVLLPDGAKIVRADIPEEYLDLVGPGMSVEIVPEGRAAQTVSGRISRVSKVLTHVKSTENSGERSDMRTANCIITVARDAPLAIGQRVVVRVLK